MNCRQPYQHLVSYLVTLMSLLATGSSMHRAVAQETVDSKPDFVAASRHQLAEIQQELQYLRNQESRHREREERIDDYFLTSESPLLTGSLREVELPNGNVTWGEDSVEAAVSSCNWKSCGGSTLCQCPTPPAPCIDCPRVSTVNPYFNVNVFGGVTVDMLFNGRRPVAPGTPYFLTPGPVAGRDQQTFDLHARQSTLGAVLAGPQLGCWQTGGQVLGIFYNDNVLADKYGFLPMLAYGELRNEDWRVAAGLQFDVFNPIVPTILPFSALSASGNSGNAFRGQVRLERFIPLSDYAQWTLQTAVSEPVPTTIDPTFRISEDNGWPNVEARAALGLGPLQGAGAAAQRPFEWGFSGVVGQLRTSPLPPDPQVVADVWGVGSDLRWRMNDTFGTAAEVYSGQGLGTYNGAILQTVNSDTLQSTRSTGGWCEVYVYLTSSLHSHWGYGIDDPLDRDVSTDPLALGRIRNETYFGNLLWDVNPTMRLGFEFTWRETAYRVLPDNEGAGFHTQCRWVF